ncbi:hypothetical protein NHQ30_003007 [Ciborinia camelliae]|nr:hypothetical protein NHQ30_003007 [Ciborinia camelliae]
MGYVNTHSVMGIGVLFVVTSVICVASRFYIRMTRKQGLGVDDWLSLPAMVSVDGSIQNVPGEPKEPFLGSVTDTVGGHSPPNLGLGFVDYFDSKQETLEYVSTISNFVQVNATSPKDPN